MVLWGPVIKDCTDSDWIGAPCPTNNTEEISAFYHALQWVRDLNGPSSTVARRRIKLLTDSEYCARSSATTPSSLAGTRPSFSESGAFSQQSAATPMTWPSPGSKPTRAFSPLFTSHLRQWVTQQRTASPPEAEPAPPVRRRAASGDALLEAPRTLVDVRSAVPNPRESCAPPI